MLTCLYLVLCVAQKEDTCLCASIVLQCVREDLIVNFDMCLCAYTYCAARIAYLCAGIVLHCMGKGLTVNFTFK